MYSYFVNIHLELVKAFDAIVNVQQTILQAPSILQLLVPRLLYELNEVSLSNSVTHSLSHGSNDFVLPDLNNIAFNGKWYR